MITDPRPKTPHEKSLAVNLDQRRYGTFAEIGAGQEVVRWFFLVGGAAGTISKSISAYDMTVSDAIYGDCDRYVCRERLESMLHYEYDLFIERLAKDRGDNTAFFAFADTVSAQSFSGNKECHGWMGVRFQSHPRDDVSQIIMHVRMWDSENSAQQEALGIVGVNLIFGALNLFHEPDQLIVSLLDSLSTERIEIDLIEFSGIEFRHVDNRLMSLRLVQLGLTNAAMFGGERHQVLQPSEVLRKKSVIVERGRFRPVTLVNLDILESTAHQLKRLEGVEDPETVTLLEITMHTLMADGEIDFKDFLCRADVLAATGYTVLISNYFEYFRLVGYLSRYTDRSIAIAMGAGGLSSLFDEIHYQHLQGGMLEAFGRLFKSDVKVFVYPMRVPETGKLITVSNFEPPAALSGLFEYLVSSGVIVQLEKYREDVLHIYSHDVLALIEQGGDTWQEMVPPKVATAIQERGLFGHGHTRKR